SRALRLHGKRHYRRLAKERHTRRTRGEFFLMEKTPSAGYAMPHIAPGLPGELNTPPSRGLSTTLSGDSPCVPSLCPSPFSRPVSYRPPMYPNHPATPSSHPMPSWKSCSPVAPPFTADSPKDRRPRRTAAFIS